MPITIVAGFTRFTGFALRAILAPSSATAGLLASGVDRANWLAACDSTLAGTPMAHGSCRTPRLPLELLGMDPSWLEVLW